MLLKCRHDLVLPGMLNTNSTDTQVRAPFTWQIRTEWKKKKPKNKTWQHLMPLRRLAVKWDHVTALICV